MRSIYSYGIGFTVGLILCALWYLVFWFWNTWGENFFLALTPGASRFMLSVLPVLAGAVIFFQGIWRSKSYAQENWLTWTNPKIVAWTAAIVCVISSVLVSALYFLFALSVNGVDSFFMGLLALIALILPSVAAVFSARA